MAQDELLTAGVELLAGDIELKDSSQDESSENVDLENPIDSSSTVREADYYDILWILVLPLVFGTYLIVLGINQLDKDCKVLTHTILIIVFGGLIIIVTITSFLFCTKWHSVLPFCNTGRVKLTNALIGPILALSIFCLATLPNIMAILLFIDPPGCTFTLNGFMIVYIGISSIFNVLSLVTILGLCNYCILCYNAK
tara:strand:+ start:495 stop:1085 length:591 start_codon:yes stop_codon:yes gene_type:complete